MKVTVEFIDHEGFWHSQAHKTKEAVKEFFAALYAGSSITWTAKDHCIISQQYCVR